MPALTLRTPDGVQLSARKTGLLHGPVVVLCDGIGCDGYIWRYLRPWLEERSQVIHFHYRGHGLSAIPEDASTLTVHQCALDVWTVIDALTADHRDQPVILMGHSMGVQVILDAAAQHASRVRALVLICGAFERPLDTFQDSDTAAKLLPILSGAAFRWSQGLRDLWRRAVPTEFSYWMAVATEINGKMIRRDDFLPYLRHMARMDPLVFVRFLESVAQHSARTFLPDLPMPALVVAGRRDHFTPERCSREMAKLLPMAELCIVPGGSHTAPLELPELLELRLADFGRCHQLW